MIYLNLIFLSSSDFTIPILESLLNKEQETFAEILSKQLGYLESASQKTNIKSLCNKTENLKVLDKIIQINIQKIKKSINSLDSKILDSIPRVSLVISQPNKQNRKKIIQNPVSIFAEKNKIKLFKPDKINKEWTQIEEILKETDFGVTASFGQIISQNILNKPTYGFINWHPSLLPLYRGASPMQEVLKRGDTYTGLSWIEMTAGMDAGNILLQIPKKIAEKQDFTSLAKEMGQVGKNTWAIAILSQILNKKSSIHRFDQPQDHQKATFTKLLSKEDGLVDIKHNTAKDIYNHFMAYQIFPKTFFIDSSYFKQKIILKNIELTLPDFDSGEVRFKNNDYLQLKIDKKNQTFLICKNNTHLLLSEILLESGKIINLKGFCF